VKYICSDLIGGTRFQLLYLMH